MSMISDSWTYSEEDSQSYNENGYHIFDHFLSNHSLAQCQREIDAMLQEIQPGRDPSDIISPHVFKRWIWDLANEPAILDMIETQIGPNIVLWSTHLLCKPPTTGIDVPWHQDAPYWNVGGPLPCGLWIAFDDMDEDNGAMAVLPGWHKKGTLPIDTNDSAFFNQMIDSKTLPDNVDAVKFQYRMPAGGMAIHHTMIPHSSTPNHSARWRRALVLRYMTADGEMGEQTYEDYRDGTSFPREYFLVRGKDVAHRGLPRNPVLFAP